MKLRISVLALLLCGVMSAQGQAPLYDYPFPESNVLFWAGSGSNSAVVNIDFDGTCLIYGVHWNGSLKVDDIMDTINTYDPRITMDGISDCYISSMEYNDAETGDVYTELGMGWVYMVNGVMASAICSQSIADGDYVHFSDNFEYPTDTYVFVTVPQGGDTPGNELPITADDILYWVGSGAGSSIVAISWDEEETALAWGVRYDDEYYPSVIDLLDTIDSYDPRFDYYVSYYMSTPYIISSITFTEGDISLSQTNTSNIQVRVITADGEVDGVSGSELEDYSIWDGDFVEISTSGLFDFNEVEAVEPPVVTPDPEEPDTLCNVAHTLPYFMDFSGYTSDQSVRPYDAGAPVPECWSLYGNGRFTQDYDTATTASIYFGGIGYATSTNSFGCMEVGNPFLALIACQDYDGTYANAIANVHKYGTKRFAVLPLFDQPLGQTVLTFNHRSTAHEGSALFMVGYIVTDTADFVVVDSIPVDYRVTHDDTVRFSQFADIPADARLTLLWQSIDTAHQNDYPSNYYCGIDNIMVVLDSTAVAPDTSVTPDPQPELPEEASIAADDILFWIGEGDNHVVMAVNWADTALAWGYRFSTDSVSSATVLNDIAAADQRLSCIASGMLSDINYIDTATGMVDTLGITAGNYWSSLRNGTYDGGLPQMLGTGDFKKWADPAAGFAVDSSYYEGYGWMYTHVFPMAIHAVSVPDTASDEPEPEPEQGPFCGAVGTEGCNAIRVDSSAIVAWATGCSLERGPIRIDAAAQVAASFGDSTQAIGPATVNTSTNAVSLGDGGMATLTFAHPIRNGEGPDFAVFENGIVSNVTGNAFLELAFVEVSSDGERFVRFPATSLTPTETQMGSFGEVDPTMINNLAGKYQIGYGTPFDLEELRDSVGIDIDNIVFVRVVDVVGTINQQYATYDAFGHIVNDPFPTPFNSSGFDLTGVAVMYENTDTSSHSSIVEARAATLSVYPNPAVDRVAVLSTVAGDGEVLDIRGCRRMEVRLREGSNIVDLSGLPQGVYMLRVDGAACKIVKKK